MRIRVTIDLNVSLLLDDGLPRLEPKQYGVMHEAVLASVCEAIKNAVVEGRGSLQDGFVHAMEDTTAILVGDIKASESL